MTASNELTSAAARLVVEDGLEYGAAKHKAARELLRRHVRAADLPAEENPVDVHLPTLAVTPYRGDLSVKPL